MQGIFPSDQNLQTSDNTTNNVSATKHGFAPKNDGTTTKFLAADGTYRTPAGGGKLVQRVYTAITAEKTITATIPFDDTPPQSGEGTEVDTVIITPTSTSNFLSVRAVLPLVSRSTAGGHAYALFKDADASCLNFAFMWAAIAALGFPGPALEYYFQAPSTSAITFKLRAGVQTGDTLCINKTTTTSYGGAGLPISYLIVEEWTP